MTWAKKGNNVGGGGGKGKLTQSSRKWLKRQEKDDYVKKAKADGSPSRAIFKLEEIVNHVKNRNNEFQREEEVKLKFLQPGDAIIDLGVSSMFYAYCIHFLFSLLILYIYYQCQIGPLI